MFAKEVLYSLSSCLKKLVGRNYKLLDFIRTEVVVDNISQLLLNNTIHVRKIAKFAILGLNLETFCE